MSPSDYRFIISRLSEADGGGFLASVPDLPGCVSDGETPEDAAAKIQDAIAEWIDTCERMGRPVPYATKRTAHA